MTQTIIDAFYKKIEREYSEFRDNVLQLDVEKVYDMSVKNNFYDNIYYYFQTYDFGPDEIWKIKIILKCENIFKELWNLYMSNDEICFELFEDVDYLVHCFYAGYNVLDFNNK